MQPSSSACASATSNSPTNIIRRSHSAVYRSRTVPFGAGGESAISPPLGADSYAPAVQLERSADAVSGRGSSDRLFPARLPSYRAAAETSTSTSTSRGGRRQHARGASPRTTENVYLSEVM